MQDTLSRPDWLEARVLASPERLAIIAPEAVLTWSELDVRVNKRAAQFVESGVRQNSHVAVWMKNSTSFVETIFALARLGAVMVPLNVRLTEGEIVRQIRQADCTFLIIDALQSDLGGIREVLESNVTLLDLSRLADSGNQLYERGNDPCRHTAIQALVFTSGTTGVPKAAMLTFGNHFYSAVGSAERLGHYPDDRWLLCMPLYHVGGIAIVWRASLFGFAIILLSEFDEEIVLSAIERYDATLISLVPTMLERLLKAENGARILLSLRTILLGGAAAGDELMTKARTFGLKVATTYGLTEAASQVATDLPGIGETGEGIVGRPMFYSRVRIADPDGKSVPVGDIGEIRVSGPTIMAGYYRDQDATDITLQNGELRTGDIGCLDKDGFVHVFQRRADLIVCGGENIYPAEVEQALLKHPDVAAGVVVGIPDAEWGQRVGALVIPREGSNLNSAALDAHCQEQLAGYKRPRVYVFTEAIPLTASGKIDRLTVIEILKSEVLSSVEASHG